MTTSEPEGGTGPTVPAGIQRLGLRRPSSPTPAPEPVGEETPVQLPPVPRPETARRPTKRWIFLGCAAALAGVVAVVIVGLSGSGTYELGGVMTLTAQPPSYRTADIDSYGIVTSADKLVAGTSRQMCWGNGGYADIRDGAAVTVYDESGKLIATGTLGQGRSNHDGHVGPLENTSCTFPISVRDIPKGAKFYQVEVTHRGKVTVDDKPENGKLFAFLSLGS